MAFGNVCELKGWKYQSHQIDNLNNSYEIEFWEIGLLHAGFQSVWLWMNDIWVTLESLVVKDSLSRWTQKMGNISPYLHVVTLSFPNTVLWVLWLHFELVISLSVRSWIITEFRTCFIYINMSPRATFLRTVRLYTAQACVFITWSFFWNIVLLRKYLITIIIHMYHS